MKNIFTCFLLLGITYACIGQNYLPMLNPGSNVCWGRKYVDYISLPPIVEDRATYFVFANNTEIIGDIEYTGLFNDYDPVEEDIPIGYLREDPISQQVFYLNMDENFPWLNCEGEEILLYDFSAEIGDTVYHCPNSDLYYVVQAITTEEEYMRIGLDFMGFGGGRVYEVYSSVFNFSTIYEGVGSDIGPIHEPPNVSAPGNELLTSYTFGCEFILNTYDLLSSKIKILPNPVQDVLTIQLEEENLSEVRIYDLSGQVKIKDKILERNSSINLVNLSNGLYFISGYDKAGRQILNRKFIKM